MNLLPFRRSKIILFPKIWYKSVNFSNGKKDNKKNVNESTDTSVTSGKAGKRSIIREAGKPEEYGANENEYFYKKVKS